MPEQALAFSETLAGDPDRLATLLTYDFLDTPPETGFDDMTQQAAETITFERNWTDGTVDTIIGAPHFCDSGSVDDLKAGRHQGFESRLIRRGG